MNYLKDKDNIDFVESICKEATSLKEWSKLRICIFLKYEKTIFMNDFHLLPSIGHAGVRRMVDTIKKVLLARY